jgi:hypothetical protein
MLSLKNSTGTLPLPLIWAGDACKIVVDKVFENRTLGRRMEDNIKMDLK